MSDLPTPVTREEHFLNGIAQGDTSNLPSPVGREEQYLDYIARNGGGGGGGTTNYNALENKPQIAGTTLQGNKSLADLGIASASDVETALGNKVDKVEGKGLSTNDYSDTEKGKVADNTSAIEAIVNEYGAKNILKYPYTDSTNTQGGLTFTDNGDGTVDVSGSETTGSNVYFALENNISVSLGTKVADIFPVAGRYTISCENADGTNIFMNVYIADVGNYDHISADGTVIEITNAMMSKTLRIHLEVKHDYTLLSAVTLKPMIRDARIKDPTYVPYAMTNRELTEKTLKYVEIPYSSFSWVDTIRAFKYSSPSINVTEIKGFIVTPLNGQGILGGSYSEERNTIYVMGWIPSGAESIDSNWRFRCFVVY